jgi:hypothetical protein
MRRQIKEGVEFPAGRPAIQRLFKGRRCRQGQLAAVPQAGAPALAYGLRESGRRVNVTV